MHGQIWPLRLKRCGACLLLRIALLLLRSGAPVVGPAARAAVVVMVKGGARGRRWQRRKKVQRPRAEQTGLQTA